MLETTIVVPCYNEAARLRPDCFLGFAAANRGARFVFVDDGSTDATGRILETMCASNPERMQCLRLARNRGKAEAVRQGVLRALESKPMAVGYWDADLSTPLWLIPTLCQILESRDASIVLGSRVKLLGRRIDRRAWRHYLGRAFATCASLVLDLPVYDTQCGAKVFKSNATLRTVFSRPFSTTWIFDVEILARFRLLERAKQAPPLAECAVEYPLDEWRDVRGSKLRSRDAVRVFLDLVRLFLLLRGPGARRDPGSWHRGVRLKREH